LVSVFNLDGAEARAKKAKEENREPRHNYFGQFVAANTDALDEVLNYMLGSLRGSAIRRTR